MSELTRGEYKTRKKLIAKTNHAKPSAATIPGIILASLVAIIVTSDFAAAQHYPGGDPVEVTRLSNPLAAAVRAARETKSLYERLFNEDGESDARKRQDEAVAAALERLERKRKAGANIDDLRNRRQVRNVWQWGFGSEERGEKNIASSGSCSRRRVGFECGRRR